MMYLCESEFSFLLCVIKSQSQNRLNLKDDMRAGALSKMKPQFDAFIDNIQKHPSHSKNIATNNG